MNTSQSAASVPPSHLRQLESEIIRLGVCLEEKPSPAVKSTLEKELDYLRKERDAFLRDLIATSKQPNAILS